MSQVCYGFWKDKVIDNRGKPKEEWSESPFKTSEKYGDKPLKALVDWDGFLVFDEKTDILAILAKYMFEISSDGCCGRCFPGRVGTRLLAEQLMKIRSGAVEEKDLDKAYEMAESINLSAKCTVAPTAAIPVMGFLKNFRDQVEKDVVPFEYDYHTHVTAPCTAGCPANVPIPEFIEEIKDHRYLDAIATIRRTMPLAGVCGRVCPHPCEDNCRRGLVDEDPVSIMVLKRAPWDYEYYQDKAPKLPEKAEPKDKKVGIVGAGPAGLTAAYYLTLMGYECKIYEWMQEPGGMVALGIPDYREPRHLLRREVDIIQSLGVEIEYGRKLGDDVSLEYLKKTYDAVLVTIGAWKSRDMGIEGEKEGYEGVLASGILFLRQQAMGMETNMEGKKVVVVGGGNTAIDCVRVALREGATDVNLIYRRSRKEMPAEDYEIADAIEEGINFHFLCNPTKVLTENNKVVGVEAVRMELGEPDESGRRRPQPVEGSEFIIDCDIVIPAIGQFSDLTFLKEEDGIEVTKWNTFKVVDDLYVSSDPQIFSAGDCEWGPMTVVKAIGAARWSAIMIDRYLQEGKPYLTEQETLQLDLQKNNVFDKNEDVKGQECPTIPRVHQHKLTGEERRDNYEEVEKPYTDKQAYDEATRCLRCVRMAMVALENVREPKDGDGATKNEDSVEV
ncbi:FAD-dependent oxidoreductase [Limisalsivibrio acetivorans]|uniref:FAD-dependent oxidoreductase n=1 Tax=Limisalsivibrio acetivorans TaxID=1304888 RepID=UPI0003B3AEB6|nr:FAD-dependent oxidoreductase [Limisalsivibrio acetivorans]